MPFIYSLGANYEYMENVMCTPPTTQKPHTHTLFWMFQKQIAAAEKDVLSDELSLAFANVDDFRQETWQTLVLQFR